MTTQNNLVQVKVEIGHQASLRKKVTPNGFTHDWTVFVRGQNDSPIHHFVDKVIFHLHESFQKPRRVVKEAPFQVTESGYAGFLLPVELYFKNKEEPKKIRFEYDLFLQGLGGPAVNNSRCEKLTFQNPTEEFKEKLFKAGAAAPPTQFLPIRQDMKPIKSNGSAKTKLKQKMITSGVASKETKSIKDKMSPKESSKRPLESSSNEEGERKKIKLSINLGEGKVKEKHNDSKETSSKEKSKDKHKDRQKNKEKDKKHRSKDKLYTGKERDKKGEKEKLLPVSSKEESFKSQQIKSEKASSLTDFSDLSNPSSPSTTDCMKSSKLLSSYEAGDDYDDDHPFNSCSSSVLTSPESHKDSSSNKSVSKSSSSHKSSSKSKGDTGSSEKRKSAPGSSDYDGENKKTKSQKEDKKEGSKDHTKEEKKESKEKESKKEKDRSKKDGKEKEKSSREEKKVKENKDRDGKDVKGKEMKLNLESKDKIKKENKEKMKSHKEEKDKSSKEKDAKAKEIGKDNRSKESKESKSLKENKDGKILKDGKENKTPRDGKGMKSPKEMKDKSAKESKNTKSPKDSKETPKDSVKSPKEGKDLKHSKEEKEMKSPEISRDNPVASENVSKDKKYDKLSKDNLKATKDIKSSKDMKMKDIKEKDSKSKEFRDKTGKSIVKKEKIETGLTDSRSLKKDIESVKSSNNKPVVKTEPNVADHSESSDKEKSRMSSTKDKNTARLSSEESPDRDSKEQVIGDSLSEQEDLTQEELEEISPNGFTVRILCGIMNVVNSSKDRDLVQKVACLAAEDTNCLVEKGFFKFDLMNVSAECVKKIQEVVEKFSGDP
eukprot:XP_014790274.1 PREDICTED: protein AF-9-like isoform X2 [Octopus bimaculoides]